MNIPTLAPLSVHLLYFVIFWNNFASLLGYLTNDWVPHLQLNHQGLTGSMSSFFWCGFLYDFLNCFSKNKILTFTSKIYLLRMLLTWLNKNMQEVGNWNSVGSWIWQKPLHFQSLGLNGTQPFKICQHYLHSLRET